MPYLTQAEQIFINRGVQTGIQLGILQEAREMVLEALEVRFQIVPVNIKDDLEEIDDRRYLKSLHRIALTCANLDEFTEKLELAK